MILNSPYISGSLTVTGNITAQGGINISGSIASASYAVSASEASKLQGLGSASFAPAATFNTVSQSYAVASGSLSTRVTNLEVTSSTVSQSFASTSGSISSRVTLIEGQYATTGSNIFTGPQYASEASNAISFTSTASLYTDGGLRVGKSAFISGTAYFNDVVVYGTSSIEYITSSQVNIGSNIITVNTDTPAVRFGGLSVFDSGSTQLTGSLFWDSEKNHWIYSNPSGSSYNSGMIMSGPRNSGSLGDEQGTTFNALMKGQGGDHITSSQMFDDGTTVRIPGALQVTGSLVGSSATFTSGLINGTTDAFFDINRSASGNAGRVRFQTAGSDEFEIGLKGGVAGFHITKGDVTELVTVLTSGSVGIGTTNPTTKLTIESSTYDDFIRLTRTGAGSMGISATNPRGIQTTDGAGNFVGWHVNSSGSVGIGTNAPATLLTVQSSGANGLLLDSNLGGSSSSSRLFIRNNADTFALLVDTNGLNILSGGTVDSSSGTPRVIITSGGNVGIGTTSPTEILQANGSIRALQTSNTGIAQFAADASNTTSLRCGLATFGNSAADVLLGIGRASNSFLYKNGGTLVVGTEGAYPLIFSAGDAERMRITNTGLVGIGYSNPQAFVDTSGFGNLVVGNGGSGDRGITIYSGTTGRGGLMFADATTGSGGYIGYILYNHSTDTMEFATSSVPRLFIKADGRTWIGGAISGFDGSSAILQINGFTRTSGQMIFHNPANVAQAVSVACNGADSFNVAGAFSANSKSFLIPHPLANLESTHNLRYVSVEAPQADLYYRGRLTLVNGKGQANIDEAATMTEGTFEALCREVQCFTTNETGWDLVRGKVIGNILHIESQNVNSTDEISWLVIGERKDKHMMDTSWTDENGRVIVEPLISTEPKQH